MTAATAKTKPRKAASTARKPRSRAVIPVQKRRYEAAVINRLTTDWIWSHTSANKEIEAGLETIRARARDLERNDTIARRYLALVESNIVGKSGFKLRIKSDSDEAREIERSFAAWLDKCDVSGFMSGQDLQRLVIRSVARDGESIALFTRGKDMPDGLGVRILESDYLPIREKGEHKKLRMGVQVDDAGRPVKYSLTTEHPGEKYDGQRIVERAAGDVVHVFRQERPGQLRAVSWLTPAMMPIKMLHGYQEAELVAARVASCQMGFYTVAPGNDWGGDGEDAAGNPVTDAAPGTFERLPSGWDFKSFTPTHPTAQYSDFVKAVLREIASGLGVSYSALANDGSDANYSSMREMSILERENWMVLQDWFARAFMRRLYREWIGMAEVKGKFAFNPAPYYEADQWTGRTWPWVDPQKDANARETDVQMGLTAPSVLAEEKGVNYAEMILRIAEDERLRAAAGLPSLFVAKQPAGGTPNA